MENSGRIKRTHGYRLRGGQMRQPCLFTVRSFQIFFHCLVHDVFQRHVLLDGEEFHTGMNAFVDDEVAMNRRFFLRGGCYRLFSAGRFFVDDSNPSSPPFILSFSKSLLLISGLF